MPLSGRIVPEFSDPRYREIIYGNYRIVYRTNGPACEILAVVHASRDFSSAMKCRGEQ
jgi:plasmid stabilization system protein ParE